MSACRYNFTLSIVTQEGCECLAPSTGRKILIAVKEWYGCFWVDLIFTIYGADIAYDFYREIAATLPTNISREIGHFNAFRLQDLKPQNGKSSKPAMPYNRRAYFKISLISGRNRAEYADKVINIEKNALLYATPRIPYHWLPIDKNQSGSFCIFTHEFSRVTSGLISTIFRYSPRRYPFFQLTDGRLPTRRDIRKEFRELDSVTATNTLATELCHGTDSLRAKLQPYRYEACSDAAGRVTSLFMNSLNGNFRLSPRNNDFLRGANDYADRLSIHVNHLIRC